MCRVLQPVKTTPSIFGVLADTRSETTLFWLYQKNTAKRFPLFESFVLEDGMMWDFFLIKNVSGAPEKILHLPKR